MDHGPSTIGKPTVDDGPWQNQQSPIATVGLVETFFRQPTAMVDGRLSRWSMVDGQNGTRELVGMIHFRPSTMVYCRWPIVSIFMEGAIGYIDDTCKA
jgi:endonuclease V-like protein UPF0215 family